MNPLESYLRELRDIRSSGEAVAETSYYSALSVLLNEVGKGLKPRIRCIINIKNRGAGIPDGGLFTPDQIQRAGATEPLPGQIPARGVIEVKGTGEDAWLTADGEQVTRYWGKYGQVLVTNLRDFVLVGQDAEGRPTKHETYRLAESEAAFWAAAASPRSFAARHDQQFLEYLRRVMLHAAPLATPQDVAWFLASYAREGKARIERAELAALSTVRSALEETVGVKFEGKKGDDFFRSTLVQTLFYGLFSAWVLWAKQHPPSTKVRFNWHETAWWLHVPLIRVLFEQVATPSKLEPLGLVEVMDWAEAALNRVDRASFFDKFEEARAVQYFYEPFLEAFDPRLRKRLGVWYTPPEVVKYMVARVDAVLREELGIADGLADPRVYVLDPCAGTGSFLVEVLWRIGETAREKGGDALTADDVKRAVMERVFGFELLPAPFVVAHLQLGLLLESLGAPLSEEKHERAGVYLTSALTGWEPPEGPQQRLIFPEFEEERDAAERVKREAPILVILGNPPYNGYAGVAMKEERSLVDAYRKAKATRQPQGQGLNDLYVRFFRMAERRIVEQTGQGVVCLISNYSWLDGLSFSAMRERYLEVFDRIWIDSLNGDKFKTGKLTPEGEPDPSIFSTEWNREGIQVGTAIALLVRKEQHEETDLVRFRNLWGKNKRTELLTTTTQDGLSLYREVRPPTELGLPYLPIRTAADYPDWPQLPDLFPASFPGIKTSRDDFLIDIERAQLVQRLEQYFDPQLSHDEVRRIAPAALKSTARFQAESVRDYLRKRGFLGKNVIRYCYRPFDIRWLYWEPETKLLDERRESYFLQAFEGNVWISAGQRNRKEAFYQPQFSTRLADHHIVESNVAMFPLYVRHAGRQRALLPSSESDLPTSNLSGEAKTYLVRLGATEDALFYHALAILHSAEYRLDNAGALRQDWPRVALPASGERLLDSTSLGQQVATLLDAQSDVPGVTAGQLRSELRTVSLISRVEGGSLDPAAGDLGLTAGWGHAGRGGATMPGKGRAVEREYTAEERAAIDDGATALGLSEGQALACLGETTFDIHLNDRAYWRNVPAKAWEYTIGGYQVIKKWLSYRELSILGRPLTGQEARDVMNMTRRIAAILLLEPTLDANYLAVKTSTYQWPGVKVT